jgi:hypothetical protein
VDDSYIPRSNKNCIFLISDMEKLLEAITKWLKQSDLKASREKTERCLFYKNNTARILRVNF